MASNAKESALQKALANLGATKKPVASTKVDITTDGDMSFSVLPIDQIEPYHYNPRTSRNPRYEELRESIKADGITNILTVTRPPKESKYTTYGGGNTRLMIAKELHAAGETLLATLQVIVKSWPGEAQIISAQLSENENRADITFWEKAGGVDRFRQEFEKESGKSLSTNSLHAELKTRRQLWCQDTAELPVCSGKPATDWSLASCHRGQRKPAASVLQLATPRSKTQQGRCRTGCHGRSAASSCSQGSGGSAATA